MRGKLLRLCARHQRYLRSCRGTLYLLFGEVGELLNTISEGVDAVTEATRAAASIAATPQKIAAIIATPTSAAEAAAAGKQVEQLISDAGVPASPIEVGAGP